MNRIAGDALKRVLDVTLAAVALVVLSPVLAVVWVLVRLRMGSPVLFRKRYVFDQEDRHMEYNIGYYKADSFVYTIESRRNR